MKLKALAAIAALLLAAPAWAQDASQDEVVVSGFRASPRAAVYAALPVPAISLSRRADSVIIALTVASDSREAGVRQQEIQRTLQDIAQRARGGAVSLALQQDDVLRPFTVDLAMRLLSPGPRPDTSQVTVQMRTAVAGADDTLDAARQRFVAFVRAISRTGRASADISSDVGITLKDIPSYRAPLIQAITADAAATAQSLGSNYRAELSGMESPVAWRKSGDLMLTLFIPYELRIVAADSH
ncbi:MAG TPA: hypothetical protein VG841_14275 [Caulobacterales bacterium]|nr:hypothetical protein [Caulobacterales bacterium]